MYGNKLKKKKNKETVHYFTCLFELSLKFELKMFIKKYLRIRNFFLQKEQLLENLIIHLQVSITFALRVTKKKNS